MQTSLACAQATSLVGQLFSSSSLSVGIWIQILHGCNLRHATSCVPVWDADGARLQTQQESDFPETIRRSIEQCDVFMVVMGSQWLGCYNESDSETGGRQIDDPKDFVRQEIETAFACRKPVLPVLIDEADMPREDDLPPTLRRLASFNATKLRGAEDLGNDFQRLLTELDRIGDETRTRFERRLRSSESPEQRFARFVQLQRRSFELLQASPDGFQHFLRRNFQSRRAEVSNGVWRPVSSDRHSDQA